MTSAFQFEPLHEQAAAAIREMIIDGRLPAGQRVSEKALCEQFGISRTPLREALKVLAAEGLVALSPRRGATVSGVSAHDMREKFEAVRLIEANAARTVSEKATEGQLAALGKLHEQLKKAHAKGAPRDYFALNERFHKAIVAAAGNATLVDIHAALVDHLRRARYSTMIAQNMDSRFVDEHERIYQALVSREPDRAEAALRRHQDSVEADVLHALG